MPAVGIGGVFFRASDPEGLMEWYRTHLGIGASEEGWAWQQDQGPTVFMAFPRNTDYFPDDRAYMLNFRVPAIAPLIAHLRAVGIEVLTDPEWDTPETGKFARIHDPEGNPVELWEPPAE